LVLNLGILFLFKYYNFSIDTINYFSSFFGFTSSSIPNFNVLLPVGISFYTFQAIGYSIDVYKNKIPTEKNFITYALFVTFFPQLVAGPIERTGNLLNQFKIKHAYDYDRVTNGLKLIAWGMFKKVVIADRLSIFVNTVYNNPISHGGLEFIIATVFFAFQIYCDFSGYSDIAIGSAQVLGFNLMDNFNRPYFSKSISEFWKRWHISLSTWFKDYVYIPLGGNRCSNSRQHFNLFITFLLSGLWHGANITFVLWGALNGFYLIFSLWTKNIRNKLADIIKIKNYKNIHDAWSVLCTFSLICFSWIFFRSNKISDSFYIIKSILVDFDKLFDFSYIKTSIASGGLTKKDFFIAVASIFAMEAVHLIQRHGSIRHMLSKKPLLVRWIIYYSIILSIFIFGVFGTNDFIYFQF
jgi:D-alanyl-lipoteichoic acid acyltransferase DltB (MBOAT superfamily)